MRPLGAGGGAGGRRGRAGGAGRCRGVAGAGPRRALALSLLRGAAVGERAYGTGAYGRIAGGGASAAAASLAASAVHGAAHSTGSARCGVRALGNTGDVLGIWGNLG
ncbi:hypothetical protein E5986_08070 [Adlercreutzia caecimuris]|uniref:Uncharacterized protein n=1 Tax=Adlercreutzia caecimuris TaxID=671266 RepID=A0A4V6RZ72_9ACTN|nr:hypothetical protein E5986_08070 [Adlercreutzia caecimuris]